MTVGGQMDHPLTFMDQYFKQSYIQYLYRTVNLIP